MGGFTQRWDSGKKKKVYGGTLTDTMTESLCSHGGEWSGRGPIWSAFPLFPERRRFLCRTEKHSLMHRRCICYESGGNAVQMGLCLLCAPLWERAGSARVPTDTVNGH